MNIELLWKNILCDANGVVFAVGKSPVVQSFAISVLQVRHQHIEIAQFFRSAIRVHREFLSFALF